MRIVSMHDAGAMTPRCMGGVGTALPAPHLTRSQSEDGELGAWPGTWRQSLWPGQHVKRNTNHIHDNMTFTHILRCSSNKTWNILGGQSNKISGWNVVLDLIRNVFLKAGVTRMIVHCFSWRPARIWNLSVIKLNVLIMVTITSHYNPSHQPDNYKQMSAKIEMANHVPLSKPNEYTFFYQKALFYV